MKLILSVSFSLCCVFVVQVFGSGSESSVVLPGLQALEKRVADVEKTLEELKELKTYLQNQKHISDGWQRLISLRTQEEEEIRRKAKGDPGEKGEKGETGESGRNGEIGPDGRKGETGEIGQTGTPGQKGETGEKGESGQRGENGDKGDPGQDGQTGERGERGTEGPQGQKGDSGQTGTPGEKGEKGEIGGRGIKGKKGERGLIGPEGQGSPGEKGQKGEVGPPGPQGSKGLQGPPDPKSLTSCSAVMEIDSLSTPVPPPSSPSRNETRPKKKKKKIYPYGNRNLTSLDVLCDFETDGGGWTVIQRRSRGPKQEFNKTWNDYVRGFGSLDKNFWLGLENIYALTKHGDQELRIELEDQEGDKAYAKYSSFSISDASDFYRLTIGGFSSNSTAGDSMTNPTKPPYVHNGMNFSTIDRDNDQDNVKNCAEHFGSGWWFNKCFGGNLNGLYFEDDESEPSLGIIWSSWRGTRYSLAKTEMKIRTRKFLDAGYFLDSGHLVLVGRFKDMLIREDF